MRVVPAADWEALIVDAATRRDREGVHVSDTYCPLRSWVRRRHDSRPPTAREVALWAMGLGWEDWLGHILPGRVALISKGRPYSYKGLIFTPDAVVWEPQHGLSVVEIKGTRTFADRPLADMPSYTYQALAYVVLLEAATGLPVGGAYIVRLHVNGSASDAAPVFRVDRVEWDEHEREAALDDIMQRYEAIIGDQPPAPRPIAPFLCRGCREGEAVGCPRYVPRENEGTKATFRRGR